MISEAGLHAMMGWIACIILWNCYSIIYVKNKSERYPMRCIVQKIMPIIIYQCHLIFI